MFSPVGHLRCRWVCFFMGTDLEKFSITSLAHQWMLCSEWVPSEWESKQLINITIIHTTPVHQLTYCKAKSSLFVWNKSIVLFSNKTSIHFSSEKVVLSEFTRESVIIYYKHTFLSRIDGLKLKHLNDGTVFDKHAALASRHVNWWIRVLRITFVYYCDVFNQLFGLILTAPIHCRETTGEWCNATFLQICYN